MTDGVGAAVAALVRDAQEVYGADPAALAVLSGYDRRLREPLRVAVAGMVKAGKSTLLNAVIGEEIAPTDTGECTRVITWYRHGDTPRVTLHPLNGPPRSLPVRRVEGRLQLDLGGTPADEVDRLVVEWPARALRELTLIDTPGIASLSREVSARSVRFLTPGDAPSEADALIYLMRHLHASDLGFLESFQDTAAGQSGTVNALAVLSRADEVGAGRIDALLAAREVAARYRNDAGLRRLALGVVPVAGLLAQSARTLRQSEFAALAALARLERGDRERLLLSADRFVRADAPGGVPVGERAALLERFGLFGVRLACVLLGGGIGEPTVLARELARRSGLDDVLRALSGQFQARAAQLKARNVLIGVDALVRARPRPGTAALAASIERILAGAHEYRELRLLGVLHTAGVPLAPDLAADAERLIGGSGVTPARRLGLRRDTPADQVRSEAVLQLRRWRAVAENPLTDRSAMDLCQTVIRSCEALLADTTQEPAAPL
ncbi:dynamin family protein [Arthrobacter zhaoguopingii]|uniref:dynamin family protein n=1 Tax=Arthrobacter zhaoguopingii TaxID=2681491 RepID=UPI0013571C10|nr:dynamin family protein [Arthrobacter zhaoguopingii]